MLLSGKVQLFLLNLQVGLVSLVLLLEGGHEELSFRESLLDLTVVSFACSLSCHLFFFFDDSQLRQQASMALSFFAFVYALVKVFFVEFSTWNTYVAFISIILFSLLVFCLGLWEIYSSSNYYLDLPEDIGVGQPLLWKDSTAEEDWFDAKDRFSSYYTTGGRPLTSQLRPSIDQVPRRSVSVDNVFTDEQEKESSTEGRPFTTEELTAALKLTKQFIGQQDLDTLRFSLPCFIHEGDSALERSNILMFPRFLTVINDKPSPLARLLAVLRLNLHSPAYLLEVQRKPFNPVLGEQFLTHFPMEDGSQVDYFSEQVSHHPPVCAWAYTNTQNSALFYGETRVQLSFTGTALSIRLRGPMIVKLPDHNEDYHIFLPLLFTRGLLLGKVFQDFAGESAIVCPQTGYKIELNYIQKPWFGGSYRQLVGKVLDPVNRVLAELKGRWSSKIFIRWFPAGQWQLFLDVHCFTPTRGEVSPHQSPMESHQVWGLVRNFMEMGDFVSADREKNSVENKQRQYRKEMESGKWPSPHKPYYFQTIDDQPTEGKEKREENVLLEQYKNKLGFKDTGLNVSHIFQTPSEPIEGAEWIRQMTEINDGVA
eukprot:Lithocolla_globosa_v1_NODE_1128_length_2850_cov_5.969946.p1 type:complete len:595 gc:universal NODE_1128_length_2850_cov_5.969946:1848-64(-)